MKHIGALAAPASPVLTAQTPLFRLRWRDAAGELREYCATEATQVVCNQGADKGNGNELVFTLTGFEGALVEACVRVRLPEHSTLSYWSFEAKTQGPGYIEWVQVPVVIVPDDLPAKGGTGRVFWPGLEGVEIEDSGARDRCHMAYQPMEYPNRGWCGYYPGCAPMPFMAYYRESGEGLYLGSHDTSFATKEIDYRVVANGIELIAKCYPGAPGEGLFKLNHEPVLGVFNGDWQDAASIYRDWALHNLPNLPKPLAENDAVPAWVKDSPLVVTYPVTGVGHHSGPTQPNEYHPFVNAMPHLKRLAHDTDSSLLTLLMHWEGTAPWAPPYVWPPLGGEQGLRVFADALHAEGHTLGLYCSGLAWTNTADTGPGNYTCVEEFNSKGRIAEMCRGPKGDYACLICNGEGIRLGYDMCASSTFAREVVRGEALKMAASGVDYIQLLDQNLGGAAYQCHDASHGHPPAPGPWQPSAMRKLLGDVRDAFAKNGNAKVILGCEAAAAESYLEHLPVNDLRYHMGWWFGRPVPAFSFVYHAYAANFMGNQVEAMVLIDQHKSPENLYYRFAYSFAAGDLLTAVLADEGKIHWSWCTKWEVEKPQQEPLRAFVKHLNAWRKGAAKDFLVFGRMEKTPPTKAHANWQLHLTDGRVFSYPAVLATAWTAPSGAQAVFLVNYTTVAQNITVGVDATARTLEGTALPKLADGAYQLPALSAAMLTL